MTFETRGEPFLYRSVFGEFHALMSFETRCPALVPLWLLRSSDRSAGWDSHPLKIADFAACWFLGMSCKVLSWL
jgi:hypothetical protein